MVYTLEVNNLYLSCIMPKFSYKHTLVSGLLIFGLLISPSHALAVLTESQINSIVTLLQAFGLDDTTITRVDNALRGNEVIMPTTSESSFSTSSAGFGDQLCPPEQILTQRLRVGAFNGLFHSYTRDIVTQADVLQGHLNRLGFGPIVEDGKIGPNTAASIRSLQRFLGLEKIDAIVGENTIAAINNSCSAPVQQPTAASASSTTPAVMLSPSAAPAFSGGGSGATSAGASSSGSSSSTPSGGSGSSTAVTDTGAPTTPANLSATNITETSVDLSWDASTDNIAVTGYYIYNGETVVATLGNVTSRALTGLSIGTAYALNVRAFDAAGNASSASNNANITTLDPTTYTLAQDSKVSIGVYTSNDVLLRTLTQFEQKPIGTHTLPTWDGLDNDGNNVVDLGDHLKVLSHNLQPTWEGVIGNTSDEFTGTSVWARFNAARDMEIVNNVAYIAHNYSEQHFAVAGMDINNPQKTIELHTTRTQTPSFVRLDSDDTYMYMAGGAGLGGSENKTYFAKATFENMGNHAQGQAQFGSWETLQGELLNIYSGTFRVGNLLDQRIAIVSIDSNPVDTGSLSITLGSNAPVSVSLSTDDSKSDVATKIADAINAGESAFQALAVLDTVEIVGGELEFSYNSGASGVSLSIDDSFASVPSGIAVQKTSDNLYLSREFNHTITVIDKDDGAVRQVLDAYIKPKHVTIGPNGFLWFAHGINSETVEKFTIDDSTGDIASTGLLISGFTDVQGIDISPDGNTIAIADNAQYSQVFGYSASTGSLQWTLGRAESYADDARVYNDKFMFTWFTRDQFDYGYVQYQSDGSLWINDYGNRRQVRFDQNRNYVDQLLWQGATYQTSVDSADPTRVFNNWFEFSIDYSKPLLADGGRNGAWTLTHNWSSPQNTTNASTAGAQSGLRGVFTFSNGRTYTLLSDTQSDSRLFAKRFYELVPGGALRDTGAIIDGRERVDIIPGTDTFERARRDGTNQVFTQGTIAFDANHNPIIGAESEVGSIPQDELIQGGAGVGRSGEYFSNGLRVIFNGNELTAGDYHIGGYDPVTDTFKWQAVPGVVYDNFNDPYPLETGTFDIRPVTNKHARGAHTIDDIAFYFYHGENWRNTQTNYIHLFHEVGLPLIDFGVDGYGAIFSASDLGMHGNAFGSTPVKIGDDIYVYQNDESWHGGTGRWKIENVDSISVQEKSI